MKKIIIIVSAVILLLGYSSSLFCQLKDELKTEVLAYIKSDLMDLPDTETDAINIEEINFQSEQLLSVLLDHRAITIQKAFPDFFDNDTIRYLDEIPIKIPQLSRIFRIQIEKEDNVENVCNDLQTIDGVLFAEPNMDAYLGEDEHYSKQWSLKNPGQSDGTAGSDIDAELAWKIFTGNSNIKVGIIDTGIELEHEDLSGKVSGDSHVSH